jgi:transposase
MFSYLSPEERVPEKHPLRPIRLIVDDALQALSPTFAGLYSAFGRPSIPPEKLLRALLLQVLYTIRSERMLMEKLEYNLLFRWFVGTNRCGYQTGHPIFATIPIMPTQKGIRHLL